MISKEVLEILQNDIQLYDSKCGKDFLIVFGNGKKSMPKWCQITFHPFNFWHLLGYKEKRDVNKEEKAETIDAYAADAEDVTGTMNAVMNRSYGKTYTLTVNKYKRDGYVFMGWNTEADGSGMAYKNKAKIKNLTAVDGETVTLYAQWSLPYINATSKELYVGKSYTLKLTGTKIASVTSSDTSIATVSSKGVVKGKKAGEAIITLTDADGRNYSCMVIVKKK